MRIPAPKLHLKAHADSLNSLRKRWKALDGLGAAASPALWQRFDAALVTAYQPVAAQQALLNAARHDNLLARQALLATLDSVRLPVAAAVPGPVATGPNAAAPTTTAQTTIDPAAADAPAVSPADPGATDLGAATPADWKEPLRALDQFHTAWRQLGPLEHTAPHAARAGLQQHWRDSLGRIEAPLQQARQAAEAVRAQLIGRAEALLPVAGRAADPRDAGQRLRDLQADWQQQARRLPLARAVENALWARFKAASDAVFAQRDAALSARDGELAANLAAAEALLARLQRLGQPAAASPAHGAADHPTDSAADHPADNPANNLADNPADSRAESSADSAPDSAPAAIERTLAEIDRQWRQGGELPRAALAAVESRFRAARSAALQRLAAASIQRWQAGCDALAARLALCDAREAGGTAAADAAAGDAAAADAAAADLARRWADALAAPSALPTAWAQALAQRWSAPLGGGPAAPAALDDGLLRIEMALDLPATPDQQAARRQLKLQALKATMDSRGVAPAAALPPAACWAALLRQPGASPAQRARLQALVSALRRAAPGALL